ncbi:hypothetical protein GCM10023144_22270 [Pigmentiphaga soli]|uniref:Uncharacterized protein n=1 Tax=Pigmentiphaga soli TaxID=1007095 RepID=A0ABP8GZZ5_9BURK
MRRFLVEPAKGGKAAGGATLTPPRHACRNYKSRGYYRLYIAAGIIRSRFGYNPAVPTAPLRNGLAPMIVYLRIHPPSLARPPRA